MDFSLGDRLEELLGRVRSFMDEHVYPVEAEAIAALEPDPAEVRVMACAPAHVSADSADACEQVRWFPAMVSNHVMDLIDRYGADDHRSMAADNTSGFNCRFVAGTQRWSMHAYGLAVDLNPVENIWQFMRDNWLSNRIFHSERNIVDHRCNAWNKLIDQPWRIMSIGLRDWPHGF